MSTDPFNTTKRPSPAEVLKLLHLLQLSSPTLPIGGFAWSQGLETALDRGWVGSESALMEWLASVASRSFIYQEWPLLLRLFNGLELASESNLRHWNAVSLALRETDELYQQDVRMGAALLKLMVDLDFQGAKSWREENTSFVSAFALAAWEKQIDPVSACTALIWSWLENQIAAAIKAMPMGQTSGQRVFYQLADQIPQWLEQAKLIDDDELGFSLPGVVMSSMLHEVQYSRLFRS